MLFKDVAGQANAKSSLIQMWRSGRMPHALLLLGREGTGGLPLALAFAQYLFCEAKSDDDSCGLCAGCQKVQRFEHADLHFTFPVFGSKVTSAKYIRGFRQFIKETPYGTTYDWLQAINAENKQGNITAEESREIIEQLSLKSYEGGLKIQIIWRPEYLEKSGNILLKLIEEPPANTIFLLVAEDAEDVLPTIRSRTQLVRLTPIPPAEIAAMLTANGLSNVRKAGQVAQIADGSFTEALKLLEHIENDLLPAVRAWFNAIFTNNGIGLVRFSDEWGKEGREGIKNLIAYTLTLLEGALRAAHLPDGAASLSPEDAEFARKLATRKLPVEVTALMIEALTDAAFHIERNAHSKSVLLALSIRLRRLAGGAVVTGSARI
jgi:DNA polymerase-3 subunit delta'